MNRQYDKIIIGAGLYGMYAADFCAQRGQKVLVLEYDNAPFQRATYVNQARVHMGYHYPRSLTTAMKSAGYFRRFVEDFSFCIYDKFEQVYATSDKFSWTNARQFQTFCKEAGIRCEEIPVSRFFLDGMCDGAFLTEEYTYDAAILRKFYLDRLAASSHVTLRFGVHIDRIIKQDRQFLVLTQAGEEYETSYVLNASYASVNQVIDRVEGIPRDRFAIKYELCEIILCRPSPQLQNVGITVMDGPFFSIMPFGKTGFHSLTAVTFTPHMTSYEENPVFHCQNETDKGKVMCSPKQLGNCNECVNRPDSAWPYM